MLSQLFAPALLTLDGELVTIECDLASGLPGFVVVGLADKSVDEARERVRSAIKNSGLLLPPKRITLNLAPADLPKDGTGYDLGMAVAILVASHQISPDTVTRSLFLGELALDGSLRPVRGAVLAAQLAAEQGFSHVYVPLANAAEAALLPDIKVIGVTSLAELYRHLVGLAPLAVVPPTTPKLNTTHNSGVDMGHIYGQGHARRALEIAAAGGHNILLSGPPGAGKTLMSRALSSLLPPPTFEELLEITKVYSLAGLNTDTVASNRPFRAPHHTASSVALIGGGGHPRPGEISLSHRGVLFLDELPEFPRSVLEVLRQPLEDGRVTIARAARVVTYPAQFMLVATRNPCPCGYAGTNRCTCSPSTINRYQRRLSGPLLDRIDLIVEVAPVDREALTTQAGGESSTAIRARVTAARQRQHDRIQGGAAELNGQMTTAAIKQFCRLRSDATSLARQAVQSFQLSARGYTRVLKVARTIADLAAHEEIEPADLTEALQYRSRV